MTNDEKLMLAAKAIGFQVQGEADDMVVYPGHRAGGLAVINDRGGSSLWNPITDDGDALRLAVKMNITVHPGFVYTPTGRLIDCRDYANIIGATRLAIVRAAAEMGRNMP